MNICKYIFCAPILMIYYFLQYVLKQAGTDWLGPSNAPLEGFSWRGGSERDTTGILMWSEVFLTEFNTGEKVKTFALSRNFYFFQLQQDSYYTRIRF